MEQTKYKTICCSNVLLIQNGQVEQTHTLQIAMLLQRSHPYLQKIDGLTFPINCFG